MLWETVFSTPLLLMIRLLNELIYLSGPFVMELRIVICFGSISLDRLFAIWLIRLWLIWYLDWFEFERVGFVVEVFDGALRRPSEDCFPLNSFKSFAVWFRNYWWDEWSIFLLAPHPHPLESETKVKIDAFLLGFHWCSGCCLEIWICCRSSLLLS